MHPLRTLLQIEARKPAPAAPKQSEGGPLRDNSCNSCLSADDTAPSSCLEFIASDESLDRYGEVISAAGWHLDAYRRNPVFQNAHQYGDILFTLGKALLTEIRHGGTSSTSPHDGSPPGPPHSALRSPHLFQRVQFATDINPVARIAYSLYQGKFLNAVSVGFIPIRWEDGDTSHSALRTPHSALKTLRTPHSALPFRRRYLEQELLEVSAVGIPANPNALALAFKSGALEKSNLREALALLKSVLASKIGPMGPIGPIASADLIFLARELHGILRRA